MSIVTKYPSAYTVSSGTWNNQTNLQADDGAVCSITRGTTRNSSDILRCQTFGFDSVIPAGATINSVAIEVKHRVQSTANICFLENQGFIGATGGATNSDSVEPTTLTARSYASYARPGGGAWTRADLLDGTFEVQLIARNGNSTSSNTWEWDYVRVVVDYTAAGTFTPKVGSWRWYSDASPDSSMTALAAENTVYSPTSTEIQNGILRLRVQIKETGATAGTTGALALEYSEDGVNWLAIEAQTPTDKGVWYRYANGAATDTGTVSSLLLTGSTSSGKYHESSASTETLTASDVHEIDFAVKLHWPVPVTAQFRVTSGGTALPLDTGASNPSLSVTVANRPNTIDYLEDNGASTADPQTLWFGQNRRLFHDGTNWWLFYAPYDHGTTPYYHNWSGTGAWSAASTTSLSITSRGARTQAWLKNISGTPVVFLAGIPSSGTIKYKRGTISGTTITWSAELDAGTSVANYGAVTCDDGNYWWMAYLNISTATLVARRSTNADTGGAWTNAWQADKSVADTGASAYSPVQLVPLGSDKVLVLWWNSTGSDIKAAVCTDAGGFGTVVTVNTVGGGAAACNRDDWCAVRQGNYVYLAHTTSASGAAGTFQFKIYDIVGDTWSAGASPNISMTTGTTDFIPLAATSSKVYLFRTGNGPEGGEDRTIDYETFSISGGGGTWDNNATALAVGGRGNIDATGATRDASGGKIVVMATFGDDHLVGSGFALEYHTITLSGSQTPYTASATSTGTPSVVKSISTVKAAASTGTPSAAKGLALLRSAVSSGTASVVKQFQLPRSATSTATPSVAIGRAFIKVSSVVSSATPSVVKSVLLPRSATSTGTPTVGKALTASGSATSTGTPTVTKAFSVTRSVTSTATPAVVKALGLIRSVVETGVPSAAAQFISGGGQTFFHTASAVSTGAASVVKSIGIVRTDTSSGTPTVQKTFSTTRSATSTGTASVLKTLGLVRSAVSTGVASAVKSVLPGGQTFTHVSSVTSTITASVVKNLGRTSSFSSTGTPTVSKALNLTRSVTGSAQASVSKAVSVGRAAVSSGTASVSKGYFHTSEVVSTAAASVSKRFGVIKAAVSTAVVSAVKSIIRGSGFAGVNLTVSDYAKYKSTASDKASYNAAGSDTARYNATGSDKPGIS